MREERAKSEIGYVLQGSIPKAHVNNSSRDGFCRNMTPPQNRAAVKGQQGGLGWASVVFLSVQKHPL